MNNIPMTLKGFLKLKEELFNLKFVKRKKIILAISEARKLGDLKENAEYHAAREEQFFCEGRILEIVNKLSKAYVIDITKIPYSGIVIFGVTITILQICTKKKHSYKIVGDDEADFKNNTISIYSPLARGLIRKKINEIVKINTPSGKIEYKIIKIQHIL
ncbi:Transcription elongation factor GreA [Buchnera aphidicola (Tuberolachnus salignus)]|uniref:Transcription elongation factor GreA n=1 Tax=Buchnera aphidicola subsp. Tuberolachnus salignus TaxID=98804 RepID=A0A160SWX5_BUCTT|nr:Transcription elongation factor GreA [Buchnera aphidicola (Tuberolachnus salignus)]